MKIVPVILSGGSGTRLWPLSRESYPKQFLPLVDNTSLIQKTFSRIGGIADVGAPVIICNEHHRFLVAEQARAKGVTLASIILEPVGRNTAPAAACAALYALAVDPEAILLILPADHLIKDLTQFHQAIHQAALEAMAGRMVTFGIVPDQPETGFGYIKRGTNLNQAMGPVYAIERFVEKPDQATAEGYLASGEYFWNSGMFMFRADVLLTEMETYAPKIVHHSRKSVDNALKDMDFLRLDVEAFSACPKDSIDYAVMEKTTKGVVIPLDVGWSDVGSWSALWQVADRDSRGNLALGDVELEDVDNCYIRSEGRLVAAIGLSDHIVIETADAVLVAATARVQDVKAIVERLKAKGRQEAVSRQRVFRPWGNYRCLNTTERFQVKRIQVNPGAKLSAQMHYHRAEHWIVVRGTALVTRGKETFVLTEDQSTYIPLGVEHRLENPGKIPLDIIEVQSGSYLGEDDIVRFDDQYGRTESPESGSMRP